MAHRVGGRRLHGVFSLNLASKRLRYKRRYVFALREPEMRFTVRLLLPAPERVNVPEQQKCQHSSTQQQEAETRYRRRRPSAVRVTRRCQREGDKREGGKRTSADAAAPEAAKVHSNEAKVTGTTGA